MTTSKPKIPADIQAAIDLIAEEIKPIVEGIETSITAGMTQHNYGGYMSALSTLVPADDPGHRIMYIITEAMKQNGGNAAGIHAAVGIITGRDPLRLI